MKHEFMCMMVNGGSLTDAGRTVLLETAHKMWQERCTEQRITGNLFFQGQVVTDLKRIRVHDFTGVMFKGDLLNGRKLITVGFVVRLEKLEEPEFQKGHWDTNPIFRSMGDPGLN